MKFLRNTDQGSSSLNPIAAAGNVCISVFLRFFLLVSCLERGVYEKAIVTVALIHGLHNAAAFMIGVIDEVV
ncbi:hypothetical protein MLD52_19135 [Puniceicoccaceae bacterium K14]|nr:hypothetical protein [Puniceicoccaceae bacterium K14]